MKSHVNKRGQPHTEAAQQVSQKLLFPFALDVKGANQCPLVRSRVVGNVPGSSPTRVGIKCGYCISFTDVVAEAQADIQLRDEHFFFVCFNIFY